jgi:16S rRNA (cytosine967-C5)-methyltransferase
MNKKRPIPEPGMLEKVLQLAAAAVEAVDEGKCTLDDALDHFPDDCRRTLEHLLTLLYRYRKSIRSSWSRYCRKTPVPAVSSLLDAALTQCRFQQGVAPQSVVNVAVTLAKPFHADKFINAVLRAALKEPWCEPAVPAEILPDAVLKRWKKDFSAEEVAKFARLFLTKPDFTFRLCRDVEVPAGCKIIREFGTFRFASGKPSAVIDSKAFKRGAYYIQDPATGLSVSMAAKVLKDCRNLLDICAAPGGKTLMAAELLGENARITAADISRKRQELTAENFVLHKVDAEIVTADPAELTGSFDVVIADLPCSNSGVFRRRPDALWRFSPAALREVMKLQEHILSHAVRLTAPGGHLLLSTCSIDKEENQALIRKSGLTLLAEETLLPDDEYDGAFAALMQKVQH